MSVQKPLILYGVPFSQPVRAVMWLLLMKRRPFKMVLTNPGSSGENGSRHGEHAEQNDQRTSHDNQCSAMGDTAAR